jgi:cytochrome P450
MSQCPFKFLPCLKKLMMPYFHGQALPVQAKQIWAIAESVSDAWADGEPFWVHQSMEAFALEVILQIPNVLQILFGVENNSIYNQVKESVTAWLSWCMSSPEVSQAPAREN